MGVSTRRGRRLHLPLPSRGTEDPEAQAPGRVVPQHVGTREGAVRHLRVHGHIQALYGGGDTVGDRDTVLRRGLLAQRHRGDHQGARPGGGGAAQTVGAGRDRCKPREIVYKCSWHSVCRDC